MSDATTDDCPSMVLDFTSREVQVECDEIVFGYYSEFAREIERQLGLLSWRLESQDYADEDWSRFFSFENKDDAREFVKVAGGEEWEVGDYDIIIPRTDLARTLSALKDYAATLDK